MVQINIHDLYLEGQKIMGREGHRLGKLEPGSPEDKRFRGFFGVSASVALKAWSVMILYDLLPTDPQLCHMLWALAFMCNYSKNDKALSSMLGGDPKTIYNHIWPHIDSLFELNLIVIQFKNRKIGDQGNNCLLSVDGTDFRIAMNYRKNFWSHKFKASGLRYEVGLSINSGEICWWHGPFPSGKYNDLMIFKDALLNSLEEGEQVEADKGYIGCAPKYVKCPGGVWGNPDMEAAQNIVRARHETCNNRLKKWMILKQPFRHDFSRHQTVFGAVIALIQLSFESNPLFEVEYHDC